MEWLPVLINILSDKDGFLGYMKEALLTITEKVYKTKRSLLYQILRNTPKPQAKIEKTPGEPVLRSW